MNCPICNEQTYLEGGAWLHEINGKAICPRNEVLEMRARKRQDGMINWDISPEDFDLLVKVAERVEKKLSAYPDDRQTLVMDLNACHSNGCPLDFEGLLEASHGEFAHDIWGIRSNINRETGKLENHFIPRYALVTHGRMIQ